MIDFNHRKGSVYLSGGIQHASPDDPRGAGWREKMNHELEIRGFVAIDIAELGNRYIQRYGDNIFNNKLPGIKSEPIHTARLRSQIIDSDIKLVVEDSDAVLVYWDEAAQRGAGTISEAQTAYSNGIPVFVVSAWEDWENKIPAWLQGLATKIFADFESLLRWMGELPDNILLDGGRGNEEHFLCSLTGNVAKRTPLHHAHDIGVGYGAVAYNAMESVRTMEKNRYEFFSELMVKEHGNREASFDKLSEGICNDVEQAYGWLCNLKMAFVDAGVDSDAADEGAERFMRIAFGSKLTFKEYDRLQRLMDDTN